MKVVTILGALVLFAGTAQAITLEEAQDQASAWVEARKEVINDRVMACISEGNPRLCHTAWAASVLPNTDPLDAQLATVTLDDPGRYVSGPCASCFTGEGTFAAAGIAIPGTAPMNAKINIQRAPNGWGVQLVVRVQYDGTIYEKGYGRGTFSGFAWHAVEE